MSGENATYLDSSALVKLAVAEPESDALFAYLRRRPVLVSSTLARVEVGRALLGRGKAAVRDGERVLATLELVRIDDRILGDAGDLLPAELRSLDAIHLATALRLGVDLGALVSYDRRMIDAGAQLGLPVASPV